MQIKEMYTRKETRSRIHCIVRELLDIEAWNEEVNDFHVFAAINPYPTAFPYGNGMVLHFYQQQESSTTKTVHKVINKRLKTHV